MDSHQRRDGREDPKPIRDTIERELSLLSIHFGNCETFPTVVVSSLTPLSAFGLFVLQMLLLFCRLPEEQDNSGKTSLIILDMHVQLNYFGDKAALPHFTQNFIKDFSHCKKLLKRVDLIIVPCRFTM